MGGLGRDVYRRKLQRHLAHSLDQPMISLVSAIVATQMGSDAARATLPDPPPEAVGAELGSPYHVPLWSIETPVDELLSTPKPPGRGVGRIRVLNADLFQKRMSLEARYADDPVVAAAIGYDELAQGIFQIWRFLSYARGGLTGGMVVAPDCRRVIVTADSWLTITSRRAERVFSSAGALADVEGHIEDRDRRGIAFCPIDDVEFALQHGTGDGFLDACREVSSGDRKGFMLSVAHLATREDERPYPFRSRTGMLLPWMAPGAVRATAS